MEPPLKTILIWINGLPKDVSEQLKLFCAAKLLNNDTLLLSDSEEEFCDFLNGRLWCMEHVGRALAVCAVIDYIMMEQGNEKWWENNLNSHLTIVDSGDQPPGIRSRINKGLPKHPAFKDQWLMAADAWAKLRETELSYVALHKFEATHGFVKF
jgi:hypothetical protein